MIGSRGTPCIAFVGPRRIASGELAHVAAMTKAVLDRGTTEPVLIFHDRTGHPLEVDFRGTTADVLGRIREDAAEVGAPTDAPEAKGPGRPKLGVVAREVTLLPRHWEWLASQPGGASVALRKLVESARKTGEGADRRRVAQESAYRFLSAMAGDRPGFEEATRALFAGDASRFAEATENWPADVRDQGRKMAEEVFRGPTPDA